jgi:hypothetical protein
MARYREGHSREGQVHRLYEAEEIPADQRGGCLRAVAVPAMGVALLVLRLVKR